MAEDSAAVEREWAVDKREFVADRRDEIAADRDAAAQIREATADAREAALDEWERRLSVRAAELGMPAAARSAGERTARDKTRRDNEDAAAGRETATTDRDRATQRRHADQPSLRLAAAFAAIAEHLYSAGSYEEVLQRIAETAVSTVTGCEIASVTMVGGGYRTASTTDPTATSVDETQYDADEGPCLDAVYQPVVYAASFPDRRWPTLASRPTEFGVRSALSCRLTGGGRPTGDRGGGSLNSYGIVAEAFDEEAREIGLILAAHASVAASAVAERNSLQRMQDNLNVALSSRDVIGQAKGILMERLKIPPEEAFDVLRRSSQRLNEKLRDLAQTLTETGELDHPDT
jgi:hypothetical protein